MNIELTSDQKRAKEYCNKCRVKLKKRIDLVYQFCENCIIRFRGEGE